MEELNYVQIFVLGDWSHDGHSKTDSFCISTNLKRNQIETAYREGCAVVGFDLVADCCDEYEDSSIDQYKLKMLLDAGFPRDGFDMALEEDADDIGTSGCATDFFKFYLFFVGKGNSNFKYEIINNANDLTIGGYGLYR